MLTFEEMVRAIRWVGRDRRRLAVILQRQRAMRPTIIKRWRE